jgi:hypothetical protein
VRMATFTRSDDLRGAESAGTDLSGARFVESDLSGVVMRGVEVAGTDVDAPWLAEDGSFLVNGVDVIAFVGSVAQPPKRFPKRAPGSVDGHEDVVVGAPLTSGTGRA